MILGKATYFKPTALRKAKIIYNFDLSECNRVRTCFIFQKVISDLLSGDNMLEPVK